MIGYIPQEFSLYPDFSCYEMLDYFMLLDGVKNQEEACDTLGIMKMESYYSMVQRRS